MLSIVGGIAMLVTGLDGVANSAPVNRAKYNERHLGLEIGLVEAREDAEAVESLKLRVQILLLVSAVNESVQTNSILIIRSQVA